MESTITTPAAETNPQQQAANERAEIFKFLVEVNEKLPAIRAVALRKISALTQSIAQVEDEFLRQHARYEALAPIADGPVPAIEPTAPIEPGGNESD